ncbi:MAG: trypsin-like serine protease [Thermoleophilia bacterium]|nr:trypsin-like serine protease [Thermoleophilia bacterium]MDH5280508.1 trypsin-like serine protease [Thermoleophilia bacterium]
MNLFKTKASLLGVVAAVALAVLALPAAAITNGVPDDEEHPYVGQLLFYLPDEVDDRFSDPGVWANCSGTLVSPTVVVTAGHCVYGVGLNGVTPDGGNGGNEVWVNFNEAPDYSQIPPSSDYIPDHNAQRYEDRLVWLASQPDWHRGTAQAHPDYDPGLFLLHDLGVVVLDEPVDPGDYGTLPALGELDGYLKNGKNRSLFTPVGYGLNKVLPTGVEGGDIRYKATVKLVNLKGTYGVPEGTSAVFSNNKGAPHTGGTCFGDSGGPFFVKGTSQVVAVNSFGISPNCTGTDGAYRIDQEDDLDWLATFLY